MRVPFSLFRRIGASALLVGVTLLGSHPAGAQRTSLPPTAGDYVRERIDPDVGLPDTHIAAVAQTSDGYFWFGTRRGLVRFDGVGSTVFSPQNTPALKSWGVNALSVDATGALWVSTDRGLVVYERGQFRAIPFSEVPATTVWKVLRDRRGRVWVSGSFGVRVGDGQRFRAVPGFEEYIYTVTEDVYGRLWFAGRGVVASYADGDSVPVRWPAVSGQRVYDIAFDSAQTLWVALRGGVRQLDVSDRRRLVERTTVNTARGAERAQVWCLEVGPDGALWIGTDTRGVLRYDGRQLVEMNGVDGTTPDPVWWLTHDRRGNVWAGTSGGAVRFRRSPFRTVTEGLTVKGAWAVRGDTSGLPWMTADDGQVAWYDGTRWNPVFRTLSNQAAPSIWPMADGGMLIADDNARLWRATRRSLDNITAAVALPDVSAYGVFEDRDGSIFNNTSRGLLRSRSGRVDSVYRDLGLGADDDPRVVLRNRQGTLVVGGPYLTVGEGAARRRYGPAEGLTDPALMAVHETGDGLWIATADSGLYVLRAGRVRFLGRANRRLHQGINGITDDGVGYLWLTARTGLMRVNAAALLRAADDSTQTVAVRQFDRQDGLPTTDINADYQNQLFRDRQGFFWLPTYAGPVRFDPAAVVEDSVPPQVHVERVAVDGVDAARLDRVETQRHPGRVDVVFAVTDALVPRRVRAEYRIVGISDSWVDAGRQRTLSFGPLVGGSYRLEIRVAGEDGQWQPTIAAVDVEVPLTLTERAWFLPAAVLLIIVGAVGFTRWRLASARARERELSDMVAQRTADLEASRAQLEVRVAERTDALSRELAERYRLEQRLESTRRMASLGRLAGGVSHEINNALATVLGFAQLAQMGAKRDERMQADLGEVVRAGRRAANITHQLLAFARQHHTALQLVDLGAVVRDNLRSLQQLCAPVRVEMSGDEQLPMVHADVGQVEQLLVNLVKNARDAKPADDVIRIVLAARTLDAATAVGDRVLVAGRYVTVAVVDRGMGMSADVREQLFEPFFTTKAVNEGSGLGLAVVQGIVARHDGAIEVHSLPRQGTEFRVWFPEQPAASPLDETERDVTGSGQTILLAEDDPSIRQFATRMLREHGYRVLDAEDGAAATALVGKAIEAVDLVLTDVLMPNVNGLELTRLLRAARPELPILFMTGYAGLDDQALAELRATGPILAKPFTQEALLQAVSRALESVVPIRR